MAVKDYSALVDNLFKSVDVIVEKQLEALPYDRTIKCSIVNTDNADKGEYIVSDGASSYKAYSENTDYQEGIYVYVNIPNGDFNEQKMIVGKCTSDDTEYFTYVPPMETYIDITHNLIDEGSPEASLLANGNRAGVTIWSAKNLNLKGYDRLGIQASFKAWLNSMNCISGSYGLRVDIRVVENNTTQETNKYKYYSFNLDSEADMYGSPYNFETFYSQEKVVDISGLGTIDTMRVVFYQNSDFYNGDKELIPNYDSDLKMDLPDNLFIQDAYISVGYNLSDFTEDTLMLFTLDSETYGTDLNILKDRLKDKTVDDADLTDSERKFLELDLNDVNAVNTYLTECVNRKNLQLRWIHLDESTENFKSLETLPKDETYGQKGIIHWYRYKLANGVEDELAGAFYEEMQDSKDKFSIEFDPDITEQTERVKAILEYPSREYIEKVKKDDTTLIRYKDTIKGNERFLYNLCQEGATSVDDIKDEALKTNVTNLLTAINKLSEGQRILELGLEGLKTFTTVMNQVCKTENDATNLLKNLGFGNFDESNAAVLASKGDVIASGNTLVEQQKNEVEELNAYYKNIGSSVDAKGELETQHSSEKELAQSYIDSLSTSLKYYFGVDLYFNGKPYTEDEMTNAVTEYESREAELDGSVNYYESEVLILSNEQKVADKATIDLIKGLSIECDTAGYNGNYKIYDDTGKIMSSSEGSKLRTLTATYTSLVSGEDELDTAEQISWYIPIENTMIYYPTKGYEYDDYKMISIADEAEFKSYIGQIYTKTINGVYLSDNGYNKVTTQDTYSSLTNYYIKITEKDLSTKVEDGYFVITRRGTEKVGKEPGLEEADSTEQLFRIKSQYTQSAINNTIRCEVVKNNMTYSAEVSLTFGPHGINGTDYTFTLEFEDNSLALTYGKSVTVVPKVYDNENNDITSTFTDGFDFSWYSEGDGGLEMANESGNTCTINTVEETGKSILDCRYYILKAKTKQAVQNNVTATETKVDGEDNTQTTTSSFNVYLSTILPIAVRSSDDFVTFDGTTEIAYDASGVNPSYYKNKYQLYKYKDGHSVAFNDKNSVSWYISSGDPKFDARYYPQVSTDGIITVPSMYIQGNSTKFAIEAVNNGSEDEEPIFWTQPIYIHQNTYSSLMLNSWDGSLTYDEENGTILSAMIGAGEKNEDNQFNGVLMGKASKADETAKQIGLYGYNKGAQSFGFLIDGTAFLGKAGHGRILFDGDTGVIQSQNYESNSEGMKIDLNTGILISKGPKFSETISSSWDEESGKEIEKTSQAMIKIDPTPSADENDNTYGNPYFLVQSCNGNKLINISSTNMYIQTDDFCSTSGSEAGVRFDLSRSKLTGYNFEFFTKETEGEYAGSYVKIASDGNPYLEVYQKYTEDNKVLRDLKLMYIGKKNFIIQSQNWNNDAQTGVQLNLAGDNPKLTAYNFSIKAIANDETYNGSYIQIDSSGSPFFRIYYQNSGQSYYKWASSEWEEGKDYYCMTDEGEFTEANGKEAAGTAYYIKQTKSDPATVHLVDITKNNFVLRSQNWDTTNKTGTCLNMNTGVLRSYDFKIDASGRTFTVKENNVTTTKEGYLIIDSGASEYPLKIGPYFKVKWSGKIYATDGEFSGKINADEGSIGGWSIDKDRLYSNYTLYTEDQEEISSSFILSSTDFTKKINGSDRDKLRLVIGNNFAVSSSGNIYCNGADISGATIGGATISKGTIGGAAISYGSIENANISYGTITSAEITDCNIGGTFTLGGTTVEIATEKVLSMTSGLSDRATVLNDSTSLTQTDTSVSGSISVSVPSSSFLTSVAVDSASGSVTIGDKTYPVTVSVSLKKSFNSSAVSCTTSNSLTYKQASLDKQTSQCTTHLKNTFKKLTVLAATSAGTETES
jgi:hypothetical protein